MLYWVFGDFHTMYFYPIHSSLSPLNAPRSNPFPYAPAECPLVLFRVYTHLHLRTWGDQAVSLASYLPFPAPARFHSARGWDTFLPKEKSKHPLHQLWTVWATITTCVARHTRWHNSGTDTQKHQTTFRLHLRPDPQSQTRSWYCCEAKNQIGQRALSALSC